MTNATSQYHSPFLQPKRSENYELQFCRFTVLFVSLQILLGISISVLSFVLRQMSPSLLIKDTPYWAGFPLVVTGLFGIYFCFFDYDFSSRNRITFYFKIASFVFSCSCLCICGVAAVFVGHHAHRLSSFIECPPEVNLTSTSSTSTSTSSSDGGDSDSNSSSSSSTPHLWECAYTLECTPHARLFVYLLRDCDILRNNLKSYLILLCACNSLAVVSCLWLAVQWWKSRYHSFHSGLVYFTYSASNPPLALPDGQQRYRSTARRKESIDDVNDSIGEGIEQADDDDDDDNDVDREERQLQIDSSPDLPKLESV